VGPAEILASAALDVKAGRSRLQFAERALPFDSKNSGPQRLKQKPFAVPVGTLEQVAEKLQGRLSF
jgi:hypothetical protein